MLKMSRRTGIILGVSTFVLLVAGIISLPTSSQEISLRVTQPYSAAGGLSDQPRVQIEIIGSDGEYEAGSHLQLEYRWTTCKGCGGNVWADGGAAMSEANATVATTFLQDHCFTLSNIRPSSEPYVLGNPVVLFDSDKETVKEIPCP